MTHVSRISEQLYWKTLREVYFIGNRTCEIVERDAKGALVMIKGEPKVVKTTKFVNELQEAIDDGTLDALVLDCANKYHGGNTQLVIAALIRNLDSERNNLKKRVCPTNKKIEELRLETMVKFVNDRRESKTRTSGELPQWAYGPKEIDAITDPDKLRKIINSINDACCDKYHGTYAEFLGEDYVEAAKANREYARKRKATLEAKANEIDPDLLKKFISGQKVTLTADQAAQILKLLKK